MCRRRCVYEVCDHVYARGYVPSVSFDTSSRSRGPPPPAVHLAQVGSGEPLSSDLMVCLGHVPAPCLPFPFCTGPWGCRIFL